MQSADSMYRLRLKFSSLVNYKPLLLHTFIHGLGYNMTGRQVGSATEMSGERSTCMLHSSSGLLQKWPIGQRRKTRVHGLRQDGKGYPSIGVAAASLPCLQSALELAHPATRYACNTSRTLSENVYYCSCPPDNHEGLT